MILLTDWPHTDCSSRLLWQVHRSTMYSEGHSPCIESPLAAANSLQELLLQSWGGIIRVFPAVPNAWPSASFDKLWAEGGIVVTAKRHHGTTQFVQLCNRGEMKGAVRLQTDAPMVCRNPQQLRQEAAGAARRGTVTLNVTVAQGQCIVCHQAGVSVFEISSSELPGDVKDYHFFG
jgi:hypothetical protein